MLSELVKGSFLSGKTGALAWWLGNGRPAIIVMCDPPYALTPNTMSTKTIVGVKGKSDSCRHKVSYGALTEKVRRGIAKITSVAEWSMIYGVPDDMGYWRRAIEKAGACWCGVGTVKQTRGAPRLRGDAPGVRHLGLAIARKRRAGARWRGRPWAEYSETRAASTLRRPIPGTRSVKTLQEMIVDMAESCERSPVVVDPCAGTGTTLMAARALELPAIGWEVDPDTYDYAKRVIDAQGFAVEGQIDLQLEL